MSSVYLVHWHEAEAVDRAAALTNAGYEVSWHWYQDSSPQIPDPLPHVVVISLDRLPSHGRAIAAWVWEAKKRRHIPIVFAGGKPDKVAATRRQFPDAVYCDTPDVAAALTRLA